MDDILREKRRKEGIDLQEKRRREATDLQEIRRNEAIDRMCEAAKAKLRKGNLISAKEDWEHITTVLHNTDEARQAERCLDRILPCCLIRKPSLIDRWFPRASAYLPVLQDALLFMGDDIIVAQKYNRCDDGRVWKKKGKAINLENIKTTHLSKMMISGSGGKYIKNFFKYSIGLAMALIFLILVSFDSMRSSGQGVYVVITVAIPFLYIAWLRSRSAPERPPPPREVLLLSIQSRNGDVFRVVVENAVRMKFTKLLDAVLPNTAKDYG